MKDNRVRQILRQYEILKLLPRHPRSISIPEIQKKLTQHPIDISLRTLQRDLNDLSEVFIGIDKTRHYDKTVSWFWAKDAPVLNLSGLTLTQAISFNLINKFLTPLLPTVIINELEPFFQQAQATLQEYGQKHLSSWPTKIAVVQPVQTLLPASINPEVQKLVTECLLNNEQLVINYKGSNNIQQEYQLNPLGLVLRGGVSYLIASKLESNEIRLFALHRIQFASRTYRDVSPNDFSLPAFIDSGQMGFNLTAEGGYQKITLIAIFDHASIVHLYETRLSEEQVIEQLDHNRFKLTATIQETEQLFWWLLSFGYRVEVLEPLALRNKIRVSVVSSAKNYAVKAVELDQ